MDAQLFKQKIEKTIEMCSKTFYWVHTDKRFKCNCIEHATGQPSNTCPKCLGTGYRIIIKKARGSYDEEMIGTMRLNSNASNVVRKYFLLNKYDVTENDYFIEDDQVYYVFRVMHMHGLDGLETHLQVTCARKDNNHEQILQNFKDILKKGDSK